jgi:hypothetical protein
MMSKAHTRTHVQHGAYLQKYTYVCACVYVYIYMYTQHTHTHTHMHAYSYTHIHTHTHTHQLASASTQTWFRAFLIGVSAYLTWRCIDIPISYRNEQSVSSNVYRFTPLETRSGKQPFTPGIDALGLMFNGCRLSVTNGAQLADGNTLYLVFDRPASMNGWYIKTPQNGPPEDDPVRFKIEAAVGLDPGTMKTLVNLKTNPGPDFGNTYIYNSTVVRELVKSVVWKLAGSSNSFCHQSNTPLHVYDDYAEITTDRGADVLFDFRIKWPDLVYMISVNLIFTGTCWVVLALSLVDKHKHGPTAVSCGFLLCSLCFFACGFVMIATNDIRNSANVFMFAVCTLMVGVSLARWQHRTVATLLGLGLACISIGLIDAYAVYPTSKQLQRGVPINGIIFTTLSLFIYLRRKYALRAARSLIAADTSAHNAVWARILADPSNAHALQNICAIAERVDCHDVLRQCNRARKPRTGPLSMDPGTGMANVPEAGASGQSADPGEGSRERSNSEAVVSSDVWCMAWRARVTHDDAGSRSPAVEASGSEDMEEDLPGVVR